MCVRDSTMERKFAAGVRNKGSKGVGWRGVVERGAALASCNDEEVEGCDWAPRATYGGGSSVGCDSSYRVSAYSRLTGGEDEQAVVVAYLQRPLATCLRRLA